MKDEAIDLTRRFLAAVAARDLANAKACTGDDFEIIASGGQRFTSLEDFVANSKTRQKTVSKQKIFIKINFYKFFLKVHTLK